MKWLKDKRQRLAVSLLAGFLAAALMAGEIGRPAGSGTLAWWGTIYPGFCFSEKKRVESAREEKDTVPKVKISFWLAQALDW